MLGEAIIPSPLFTRANDAICPSCLAPTKWSSCSNDIEPKQPRPADPAYAAGLRIEDVDGVRCAIQVRHGKASDSFARRRTANGLISRLTRFRAPRGCGATTGN